MEVVTSLTWFIYVSIKNKAQKNRRKQNFKGAEIIFSWRRFILGVKMFLLVI